MVARCLQKVSAAVEILCLFMFVVMCVCLTVQISGRYLFARSFFWAEEIARYAMIWIVFLGAVAATYRNAHTRIEFFAGLLPAMGQRAAYVLVTALSIIFLAAITVASSNMLWLGTIMKSTALGIPMILVYSALPVSAVLMIFYLAWDCRATLRSHGKREEAGC